MVLTAPLKYTFIAALVYGLGMETMQSITYVTPSQLWNSLWISSPVVNYKDGTDGGALAPPLLLFEGIAPPLFMDPANERVLILSRAAPCS